MLIPAATDAAPARVTLEEVPVPAPPLGLLALGDSSAAQLTFQLRPNDQLLLYTDGVTEARDAKRQFYPLPDRVATLSTKTTMGLLDLIRADLRRHVGAPLDDDAALLLIHAPQTWPSHETPVIPADRASAVPAS